MRPMYSGRAAYHCSWLFTKSFCRSGMAKPRRMRSHRSVGAESVATVPALARPGSMARSSLLGHTGVVRPIRKLGPLNGLGLATGSGTAGCGGRAVVAHPVSTTTASRGSQRWGRRAWVHWRKDLGSRAERVIKTRFSIRAGPRTRPHRCGRGVSGCVRQSPGPGGAPARRG